MDQPDILARVFAALTDLAPRANRHRGIAPQSIEFIPDWKSPLPLVRGTAIYRIAQQDALHSDERLLRRVWGVVYYDVPFQGTTKRSALPLLIQPIRLKEGWLTPGYHMKEAGDLELTAAVPDEQAEALEQRCPDFLGTYGPEHEAWLLEVAAAAGFPGIRTTTKPRAGGGPWLVPHPALYFISEPRPPALADHLAAWAQRPNLTETALAAVYGAAETAPQPADDQPVVSAHPLDPDQAAAVARARRDRVTVISGAPGCGKSHALVAIALDAVDRGESVLMATESTHAADVLADLLARAPGPNPVVFGDSEKRDELKTTLATGAPPGHGTAARKEAKQQRGMTLRARNGLAAEIAGALHLEAAAARAAEVDPVVFNDAPGLVDVDCDLARVRALLDKARHTSGFLADWRRRRADRRLRRLTRSTLGHDEIAQLLEVAADHRAAAALSATQGTDLGSLWERLHQADRAARAACGTALARDVEAAHRRDENAIRAMAALATALRTGRARRRRMLAAIEPAPLLRALPLWIGTVTDVEDLLPAAPGMFDLVVLDEASHIDQLRAAPVLARARRAVVAGDPKQLRFVSFQSDATVDEVVRRHRLDSIADRLDVRRNSAFDLAAGAAPVSMLSEHYRSVPHLIGFSAARFYGGRVSTATRHPRNDAVDVIDIHHVDGAKAADGVHRAEVDLTLELLDWLLAEGTTDLAVITPFRPQAEAIEAEVLRRYTAEDIVKHRLRVGTVHSFQGSEADVVIASLAVHADDSPSRRRFAADPQLFNVLVTRARHRLHVVTSLHAADGLIGDFIDYAEHPPTPPASTEVGDWARRVAVELERTGAAVTLGYPVGRWTVDICLSRGDDAVGLMCGVHPNGVAAHIARQRVLHQVGWRLRDVFASRFGGDPVRAALTVLAEERADRPAAG